MTIKLLLLWGRKKVWKGIQSNGLGAGTTWQPLAKETRTPTWTAPDGEEQGALFTFSCPDLQGALWTVFLELGPHSWYPTALRLRAGGFKILGISLSLSLFGIYLLYNAVLVSVVQQSESAIISESSLLNVPFFSIPWTIAHQAPLSVEFSRQEYWSG